MSVFEMCSPCRSSLADAPTVAVSAPASPSTEARTRMTRACSAPPIASCARVETPRHAAAAAAPTVVRTRRSFTPTLWRSARRGVRAVAAALSRPATAIHADRGRRAPPQGVVVLVEQIRTRSPLRQRHLRCESGRPGGCDPRGVVQDRISWWRAGSVRALLSLARLGVLRLSGSSRVMGPQAVSRVMSRLATIRNGVPCRNIKCRTVSRTPANTK